MSNDDHFTDDKVVARILMYQHISSSLFTLFSNYLCLSELPVNTPTYICLRDTAVPQVLNTVYYSLVGETGTGHIDVEVSIIVVICNGVS